MTKASLGDGVYAEVTVRGALVLTAENGVRVKSRITLEPDVLAGLLQFVRAYWEAEP